MKAFLADVKELTISRLHCGVHGGHGAREPQWQHAAHHGGLELSPLPQCQQAQTLRHGHQLQPAARARGEYRYSSQFRILNLSISVRRLERLCDRVKVGEAVPCPQNNPERGEDQH